MLKCKESHTNPLLSICTEDVLIYSLKHRMLNAIKKCFGVLREKCGPKWLSDHCKLHLVIAAASMAIASLKNTSKLICNDENLVNYSYILRDLRFLHTHTPHADLEQYAAATLSLNKLIVMHLLWSGTKKEHIQNYMEENLFLDFAGTSHLSKSPRFTNACRRDLNKFHRFITTLLQNEEIKSNYIKSDMLVDYDETFWENLHRNVHSFLMSVQSHLPLLKIDQILNSDFSSCPTLADVISKKKKLDSLDEEDVLKLLNILAEDKPSECTCGYHGVVSIAAKSNTESVCQPMNNVKCSNNSESNVPVLKELSVVLSDIRYDPRYIKLFGKRRSVEKHDPLKTVENIDILTSHCDGSMRNVAETTPETIWSKKRSSSAIRGRLKLTPLPQDNAIEGAGTKFSPTNRIARYLLTQDVENKENLHIGMKSRLKPYSPKTNSMPSKKLNSTTSSANNRTRRQLYYPSGQTASLLVSSKELDPVNLHCDDNVPESDFSDDESVILSMEDDQLPDFTKFLYQEPNLKCSSVVVLERLEDK